MTHEETISLIRHKIKRMFADKKSPTEAAIELIAYGYDMDDVLEACKLELEEVGKSKEVPI